MHRGSISTRLRWIAMAGALLATSASLHPALASAKDKIKGVSAEVKLSRAAQAEDQERDVDHAALESQESSISKLTGPLKKYRDTRQEPVLLAKLAELQVQTGGIKFRIAHGAASRSKRPLDLSSFKRTMRQAIASVNDLISKYPNYGELAQAYFTRGKAFEEIEDKPHATQDYLHLVKTYPDSEQCIPAYMSLAEYAIGDNDHVRAISYLNEVEKHPNDPQYPFALYKLAWSHYNLKNIPVALSYVEKHVGYYDQQQKSRASQGSDFISVSDDSFRENMLLDATVFYFEGFEQKLSQYQIGDTLPYFRKLETGPTLGKMLTRYAKLLRSHGHETDLIAWKDRVLKDESGRPESLHVILTVYENQRNKNRYPQLLDSARDMVELHRKHPKHDSWPDGQKALLDTAEAMQALIIKNKGADAVGQLSQVLAGIYDSFTKIVDESDPRIPRVHYNLAETLFEIKDYEGATQNYRWIVTHGKWEIREKSSLPVAPVAAAIPGSVTDSSLKAIGSRYEFLRTKKLIPTELVPQSLADTKDASMDPLLSEWIGWVDQHVANSGDPIENFYFESNRCLYSQHHIRPAVERLQKFAQAHPDSRFAVPSAALTLDTYIASQLWEELHGLAREFIKIKTWKKLDFSKRLFAVAADAFYKTIEARFQARDFKFALKRSDEFLDEYASSARLSDTLFLAGSSALAVPDRKRATHYFSRLIQETPKADTIRAALLNRASLLEERYQFAEAARDYKSYLSLPSLLSKADDRIGDEAIRKKALMLAWLSSSPADLKEMLASIAVCNEKSEVDCDRFRALQKLTLHDSDASTAEAAFDLARKGEEANKSLWAIVALEGAKHLAFRDRLVAVRQAVAHFEDLDPLIRFALVPTISASIPRAFQLNRAGMAEAAPLRADARYITRRVEVIREMENAATKAMKLPWARVRALVLSEIAGLYLDLSKGIQTLPSPKNLAEADLQAYEDTVHKLVIPFEEKGQDMRSKAFEIASRFAIEDQSFSQVADPFFQDNPSQAKRLKPDATTITPKIAADLALGIPFLDRIDPRGRWSELQPDSDDPALHLKGRWAAAIQAKRWPQVAFFLGEAQEKALIQVGVMGAVRAVSLAAAGARGEALAELDEARKDFSPEAKKHAVMSLLSHYYASLSRERTQDYVKQALSLHPEIELALKPVSPENKGRKPSSDPTASLISVAAKWSAP